MALDVNKIIMESVQEQLDDSTGADGIVDPKVSADGTVLTENVEPTIPTSTDSDESYDPIAAAIPPAISAGLGALTLRNKLRTVK